MKITESMRLGERMRHQWSNRPSPVEKKIPCSWTFYPLCTMTCWSSILLWSLDILGPLPSARTKEVCNRRGNYFTKWLEAEATATITGAQVENFVWKNIICRFGIHHAFIMDSGKQFDNSKFRDFYEGLAITPRFLSIAHPQANRKIESKKKRHPNKIEEKWYTQKSVFI